MQINLNFWDILDWLAFAVTLAGVWQLSSHKKSGFIISGFASFIWAAVGFHSNLTGLAVLNILLIFIYLRGYIKK
ncbi:MAG: hypothetical protein EVJ47_00295 [Candidatus Acidulodesulfobacterium ferriphilum]|uniref:Nicotinamide riboside transporter PnuC n=1 Tax=Candidatus Acidulodesulfobacterium ferriphilum TaxID=2597223 RepID=A0A519BBV8_9DELT|nr:hypothetical protein [Deltaproteobacteria bacterium]MCL5892010.1 hypothetical protein [Deltaproteobacteria bacterium]RZD14762.1 MAG: hypothetical protein EVJ47_00295 [Candidatus Acidulodesulfobacterium ferriphilum]